MTNSLHIILPAYNEAENIERCITTIKAAIGSRDIPITLVDNQSTDATTEIARSLGVEVLEFPEKLTIAELRNKGAAHVKSDFVLFIDSDMEVPVDWIEQFEKVQAEAKADVLGFVVGVPETAPWFAKIWAMRTNARREHLQEIDFLPGHNIAVRRTLFEKVGGFSTELKTSEDKDLVMRLKSAGARVFSAPPIGIIHWGYEKTFREWTRKEFWRQSSHVNMIRRHGSSPRLLRFPLTAVFHLILCGLVIAAIIAQKWGFAAGLTALLFAPSVAQTFNSRMSRFPLDRAVKFISLYLARFHIAGVAVISEFFRTRRA